MATLGTARSGFLIGVVLVFASCGDVRVDRHDGGSISDTIGDSISGQAPESDCLNGIDDNNNDLADCEDPSCSPGRYVRA